MNAPPTLEQQGGRPTFTKNPIVKIISFNVNGIRAIAKKGLLTTLENLKADIFCFQETKATAAQVAEVFQNLGSYQVFANQAERAGYSGTAVVTRIAPEKVTYGIGIPEHDNEGRVITATFEHFHLVNVYVPNSGNELVRLDYRHQWDNDFTAYLIALQKTKPVILCGDLNVAHTPMDIARPQANYNKTAGYTQTEIDGLTGLLAKGFVDSYRFKNPETVCYSWWSYRGGAREKNIGWRLDYFIVDQALVKEIATADILTAIEGSDHCPVQLELK